jgi:hypothetical protein
MERGEIRNLFVPLLLPLSIAYRLRNSEIRPAMERGPGVRNARYFFSNP